MQLVDPDDLYPIDLADAPAGAPPDVDYAVTELLQASALDRIDPKAFAAFLAAHPERWRIEDDDGAEWAAGRLAEMRATMANDQGRATEYHAKIDRWLRARAEPIARRAAWFEAHLIRYALGERAKGRKSVRLPSANLSTRGSDSLVVSIDDADIVLAWAKARRPDLVKVDETVLVTPLRAAVDVEKCGDCDGMGEVVEMGSDPNLTETVVECSCHDGVRVWSTTADGERVEVFGVGVALPPPSATVST